MCIHSSRSWGIDAGRYACVVWLRIPKVFCQFQMKICHFSKTEEHIEIRTASFVTRELWCCLQQLAFVNFIPKTVTFHTVKTKKKYAEWYQLWQWRDAKNRSPARGHRCLYSCVPIHLHLTPLSKLSGFIICKISQLFSFQRALETSYWFCWSALELLMRCCRESSKCCASGCFQSLKITLRRTPKGCSFWYRP